MSRETAVGSWWKGRGGLGGGALCSPGGTRSGGKDASIASYPRAAVALWLCDGGRCDTARAAHAYGDADGAAAANIDYRADRAADTADGAADADPHPSSV